MSRLPAMINGRPSTYLVIDMTALVSLKPEYEKNALDIWNAVGQRHRSMLRKRFIALSAGAGQSSSSGPQWPALQPETIRYKRYMQKIFGFSGNVNWILRLSQYLVNSFDYIANKKGYIVGVYKDRPYNFKSKATRDRASRIYCRYTVAQLAYIHHTGAGRVPARPIVVAPNNAGMRELMSVVVGRFNKMIASMNSRVGQR